MGARKIGISENKKKETKSNRGDDGGTEKKYHRQEWRSGNIPGKGRISTIVTTVRNGLARKHGGEL